MISNIKKKAIYKSALAVLLVGTMLTGCSKNEENPTGAETNETGKTDTNETSDIITEIMTEEESNSLTAGQFISTEELTKLPDAAVLEKRDLAFVYVYTYLLPESSGVKVAYGENIRENLAKTKVGKDGKVEEYASNYKFEGIQILPITNYIQDLDSTWLKWVDFEGTTVDVGPVITEEKIKELNEKQETQQ